MADAFKNSDSIYNYGQYCSWPDEDRCELINGVIYGMTPPPSKQHADILGELFLL